MDDQDIAAALRARMGGRAQAMAIDEEIEDADVGDVVGDCPLAQALLTLFCWSDLSLPQINWLARCARDSDTEHRDLVCIAELGDSGKYAGNMRRDLMRWFADDVVTLAPLRIQDAPPVNNIDQSNFILRAEAE